MRRGTRSARAFEGFDDDHVPAAARAQRADIGWFVGLVFIGRRGDAEQAPGMVEMGLAGGTGEQAVMTDAVEPFGQNVEQEAAEQGMRADALAGARRLGASHTARCNCRVEIGSV